MPYAPDPETANSCPLEFRVVLWVSERDQLGALATLQDLERYSLLPASVTVSSPTLPASPLSSEVSRAGFTLLRERGPEECFVAAIRGSENRGLFFVKAGVRLPEGWDLRLFWTSRRHEGVGAVAPWAIPDPLRRVRSLEETDRLAYIYGENDPVEVSPSFDCLYVSPAAIRAVAAAWNSSSNGAGFNSFREVLRRTRFRSLLASHVSVSIPGPRNAGPDTNRSVATAVEDPAVYPGDFAIRSTMAPASLHVLHSWGGGLRRWVHEYGSADRNSRNFLLKSIGNPGTFGVQLWLYRNTRDSQPIRRYPLDPHIPSTDVENDSYARALAEIIDEFGIENIIVSSLIGHSLDALRTNRRTIMVCHDYYPFCPALNITFKSLCRSCSEPDLNACTAGNPHNRFFNNVPPPSWIHLRDAFAHTIQQRGIPMIAPSQSVQANYVQLDGRLEHAFQVIPHGSRRIGAPHQRENKSRSRRLQIVVLGALSPNKGLGIINEIKAAVTAFADLHLVGAGMEAAQFANEAGMYVVEGYSWHELPGIIAKIDPDLALLPSVVPETFSYTLQELFELCIPVLATRLGSFVDRITDGENGFLCEPAYAAVLECIRRLDGDRDELAKVRANLVGRSHRSMEEMLNDYRRVLNTPSLSARGYFSRYSRSLHRSTSKGHCKLFSRAERESFTEQRSESAFYPIPAAMRALTFHVLKGPGLKEFRLDVHDTESIVLIHDLSLRDKDGTEIWKLSGSEAEISLPARSPSIFLRAQDGSLAICGSPDDCVHRLTISVPAEILNAVGPSGEFSLTLSSLRDEDTLTFLEAEGFRSGGSPELEGPVRTVIERLEKNRSVEDIAGMDLQRAYQRIRELESSLSWRWTKPVRSMVELAPGLLRIVTRRK